MAQVMRWAFGLLLPSLLWACTAGEKTALPVSHEQGDTAPAVQLDKPVHFTAPGGASVLAAPDEYLVEQAAEAQLRLVPHKGGAPLLLAADTVTHDIDLSSPFPLLLAFNDDARNLVLLKPDGTALDAAGSLSGVQSREIVRQPRHYKLAYRVDPSTGRVMIDREATRAPDDLSAGNALSNYEIQNVMSQYNQAESLALAVQKKLDEQFRLEYDRDRPGSDYAQRAVASPESCRTTCSADGNCQAFTFVRSPVGSSTGQCFLKRIAPAAVANPCCISGQRKSAQQMIR